MDHLKGKRLYVGVGASEARRRLKHFGHGVRKVHSAGRNRAVIIHTATGQHLRELEALFADTDLADSALGLPEPEEKQPKADDGHISD